VSATTVSRINAQAPRRSHLGPRALSRSLAGCSAQAAHDLGIDLEAEAIIGGVPMPKIERYRFGHIVVEGEERIHDLIVLPGRVALHLTC
jgi:hypothetical protein